MIAYVLQKCPKNFAFQLFCNFAVIYPWNFAIFLRSRLLFNSVAAVVYFCYCIICMAVLLKVLWCAMTKHLVPIKTTVTQMLYTIWQDNIEFKTEQMKNKEHREQKQGINELVENGELYKSVLNKIMTTH